MCIRDRRSTGRVPAIVGWDGGPFLVNARVRELMETLEPDTHRFLPVEAETCLLFTSRCV